MTVMTSNLTSRLLVLNKTYLFLNLAYSSANIRVIHDFVIQKNVTRDEQIYNFHKI